MTLVDSDEAVRKDGGSNTQAAQEDPAADASSRAVGTVPIDVIVTGFLRLLDELFHLPARAVINRQRYRGGCG